jgi:hemerythrin-like domain-containing protein
VRRHPALHRLTEEHHHALLQARRLREADERTIKARTQQFLTRWRSEIQPHFREEETALLPCVCPPLQAGAAPVPEVCAYHVRIRRAVMVLQRAHFADDDAARLAAAHDLAELLEEHIRQEERELFEALQEALGDEGMTALGEHLTAWETGASDVLGLPEAGEETDPT